MFLRNTIAPLVILVLVTGFGVSNAQQRIVEKEFDAGRNARVQMNLRFGDQITVKGWDKPNISFKAVILINNGRLNDALTLDFSEKRDGIAVNVDYDERMFSQGRPGDCPNHHYPNFQWNYGDGNRICSDITYEIYLPREADLKIESITADIELFDLQGPVWAKTVSGFIDIHMEESYGAEFSVETVTGEAYTNLENLTIHNKRDYPSPVGYKLRGSIGNGGRRLVLETVSGNIYIRKRSGRQIGYD